ncbi:MAG: hypothetical protein ACM3X3_04350 [Betaproteobacteria bacterium]
MAEISRVLEDTTWRLMSLPNVVGVGRGYKATAGVRSSAECIVVLVREKVPGRVLEAEDMVPAEVRGIPTDVVEVGEIRFLGAGAGADKESLSGAADTPSSDWRARRLERMRPARPGVSIGHYLTTAGTFGAVVWDKKTGQPFILSCNHVLANATSGRDGRAKVGDPIVQPGAADGGTVERDCIAVLERFVPIHMSGRVPACMASRAAERAMNNWLRATGTPARVEIVMRHFPFEANTVDAALARPLRLDSVEPSILDLGELWGVTEPELGMAVKKSGRTTGVTTGEITSVDTTVRVVYSGNVTATFRDQIVTSPMAEGGDSGSVLVDAEARAVGLLFAGSDKSTIYNRITSVLDALGVTIRSRAIQEGDAAGATVKAGKRDQATKNQKVTLDNSGLAPASEVSGR